MTSLRGVRFPASGPSGPLALEQLRAENAQLQQQIAMMMAQRDERNQTMLFATMEALISLCEVVQSNGADVQRRAACLRILTNWQNALEMVQSTLLGARIAVPNGGN